MKNTMVKELDKLNAALEACKYNIPSELVQVEPIQSTDLYEPNKDLFTSKSQEALSKKAFHQIHRDDSGTYISFYLSVRVKTKNILDGLKAIADDINSLSEKDLIHSTLAKPSSIDLARIPLNDDTSMVYSFVLVNAEKIKEAESLVKNSCTDGSISNVIGSLELDLPEGEFLACINIVHHNYVIGNSKFSLDEQVQEYLDVLPKDTELVSITNTAVYGIGTPYEVRFRNPLLKSIKEVKLQCVRMVEAIDDQLIQFSLLTGISYLKRDGTIL